MAEKYDRSGCRKNNYTVRNYKITDIVNGKGKNLHCDVTALTPAADYQTNFAQLCDVPLVNYNEACSIGNQSITLITSDSDKSHILNDGLSRQPH